MEQASVQRLARALRVMVVVVFVCNLIVLFFVPTLAAMFTENRWDGQTMERLLTGEGAGFWLNFTLHMWNPVIWMLAAAGEGQYWLVLSLFLLSCGVCTAVILRVFCPCSPTTPCSCPFSSWADCCLWSCPPCSGRPPG